MAVNHEKVVRLCRLGLRFRNTPIVDDDFPVVRDEFDIELATLHERLKTGHPLVTCLCGSTRFKSAYEKAQMEETLKGNIVLSVGMFGHLEGLDMGGEVKKRLDELHLRKIDLADEVLVLNVGNYVGESTAREIAYAEAQGKTIRYLEPTGSGHG